MHLHIVVALFAQHVNHFSDNILGIGCRPLRNLHHSLLSRLAAFQFLFGNQDVVNKEITLGHQEGIVFLHLQDTNSLVVLALQNFSNDGFFDVVLSTGHHSNPYTVAIEGEHRVALADEDRFATIIGHERVFTVSLTNEGAFLYLCLQIQAIAVVIHLAQIVIPRHLFHCVNGQHLGWVGVKP